MTENDHVPIVDLDPDGTPIDLVDLAGEARRFTVWGMVHAHVVDGLAVALILSNSDDPPKASDARALAAALDRSRIASLLAALDQQSDRFLALAYRVRVAERALAETEASLAHYKRRYDAQAATIRQLRVQLEPDPTPTGHQDDRPRWGSIARFLHNRQHRRTR